MADTVVKFTPEMRDEKRETGAPAASRRSPIGWVRSHLRLVLLVILPLVLLAGGLVFYLMGGRYISTDNAYVGSEKVLITPDISGKVDRVAVKEGQHVAPGDDLFEIDPTPYRLMLRQAQSKLEGVRTDFANLKSNLKSLNDLVDLAQKNVDLKRADVDRKTKLLTTHAVSQFDVDTALATMVTAELQAQLAVQQQQSTLNQLLRKPDLPIEEFPAYQQAKATLDQAQRDLDHTMLKAPIAGIATQVDNIQLGRFVPAGTPVFSVVNDRAPWVDANPKETDITYLRVGQKVTIDVDSFPDHAFTGIVASVSPATGAQFSILPPQNASGNWVKVVQRVPVRIAFDSGQDVELLRAGMSVTVEIDTGRRRSLASLFGAAPVPVREAKQ